ncbi:MAG TPA: enoyl-CoA hydratase/isomerase family protein, partial [Solirubrobacteraceae bacterium]|nr:enoyl-CoA hydratase/isomerase family protein [Solirubrobacteraceae bacterium]
PPRALVITGREGCFSAGADLKAVPVHGPDDRRRMINGINEMVIGVYGLRCPVVGAITGHAIAGGLVLALCTDLRVGSSAGRYGLTEVKVGVPYPQAAIGVVRAELAPHAARSLAFGNALVDGEECMRLGVFDELHEPDAVLPRAVELARGMVEFDLDAYRRTKNDMRGATLAAMRATAADDPLLRAVTG